MTRLLLPALVLLVAACDSGPVGEGGAVYRTSGTDLPQSATLLPDGSLVVGVLTEGVLAPADGTVGYPGIVRFDANGGLDRVNVYRGSERTFVGVQGVAPLGGRLVVARPNGENASVFEVVGDDLRLLFLTEEEAGLSQDALAPIPGGVVLSVFARSAQAPHLYALDRDGSLRWTYRLDGAQNARPAGTAPDGDLFVVGYGSEGGAVVARLAPDGAERWRRALPDARLAAAVGDGLALAFDRLVGEVGDGSADGRDVELRLVRLDGDGRTVATRTVASVPIGEGGLRPTAIVGLPGGAVAVATVQGGGFDGGGTTARVLVVGADGAERRSSVVGRPGERSTFVTHLLAAPGRLVVVSAVGPARLGGYGGDDFDVAVSSL